MNKRPPLPEGSTDPPTNVSAVDKAIMNTDRPLTPELVPEWLEPLAKYEERTKELNDRQKELDTSLVEIETLLAMPLGVCQPWELTDARIKMRWAVHWRDDALANLRLIEWKLEIVEATDKILELHKILG